MSSKTRENQVLSRIFVYASFISCTLRILKVFDNIITIVDILVDVNKTYLIFVTDCAFGWKKKSKC